MTNEDLATAIDDLGDDERALVEIIVQRLALGRDVYGAWRVNDGRDYPREGFEELVDGSLYFAAEVIRRRRNG